MKIMLVMKDYKKDSYQLNNVLNTSFGVNQSPTFPFYNSYMKSINNTIEIYIYKIMLK